MALCREYRLEHVLVTLGEQYVRDLPRTSSRHRGCLEDSPVWIRRMRSISTSTGWCEPALQGTPSAPTTRRSSFFRSGTSALVPVQRDSSGGRCRCALSDQLGLALGRRYLTARTRLGCSRLRRCGVDDVLRFVCHDSENPECSRRFWSGRDQAIPVVAGHRLAGVRQRYASFEAGGREWVIQRRCSGPSVGRALRWHQPASRHDSRHLGSVPRTPDFCSVLG